MRTDQIREMISGEIQNRREKAIRQISEKYMSDKDKYDVEFLKAADMLCRIYSEKQEKGKDDAGYLDIWSMRTSVLTETYAYTMRMYDMSYYYDRDYAETEWKPGYMQDSIKEDIQYFDRLIMSKVIRAKKYEVNRVVNDYIYETYIRPVPEVIRNNIEKITKLDWYGKVKKYRVMKLCYGEMMESEKIKMSFTEKEK